MAATVYERDNSGFLISGTWILDYNDSGIPESLSGIPDPKAQD